MYDYYKWKVTVFLCLQIQDPEYGDQHVTASPLCFRWDVCYFNSLQSLLRKSRNIRMTPLFTSWVCIQFAYKTQFFNMLFFLPADFLSHLVEGTCSKALYITTPKRMEALRGSCLLIPCNFSAVSDKGFNSSREIFGVWIKKEPTFDKTKENWIFHSNGTINKYPMSLTGNLTQRNCTTLFSSLEKSHTDKYFFRIENSPFLATAACDPLQITVEGKRLFVGVVLPLLLNYTSRIINVSVITEIIQTIKKS